MPKNNEGKKGKIGEDYCFFCKEGGLLRVCDYKDCLKSYHPKCMGRDDSLFKTDDYRWICGRHSCFLCKDKPSEFHCFCCPKGVCGGCLRDAKFVVVKGHSGFCISCLELALLIEDNKSNGEKVDFNDRSTFEFFFKSYWDLVKGKEGLTSKHLHSADRWLKDGEDYDNQPNYNYREEDIIGNFEHDDDVSNVDDSIDTQLQCREKETGKLSVTKRKGKEYIGWASKQLIEFLTSIGKDATQELSQDDVVTIINEYSYEHNLFDPVNKKKVVCDERLRSLFGRKTVSKYRIDNLLTDHFFENLETSDEDSIEFSLKEDDNVSVPCTKRQRKSSPDRKSEEKERITFPREGCSAAIVPENIKLVYLKKDLVLELAKEPDTFRDKMIGSFVRIKSDPNAIFRKNSHILVQVKDIIGTPVNEEMNPTILLRVFNMAKDIPVCKLSEVDFTEEEIEDLSRRMKNGTLERPTVLTFEKKVRILHEDLTKYRIKRELHVLRNKIKRANENGWMREFDIYTNELKLLETPEEQLRQLREAPFVLAEAPEPEHATEVSSRDHKVAV